MYNNKRIFGGYAYELFIIFRTIIGVAVSIFAVVVIISVIGAVAGSEEDFDE